MKLDGDPDGIAALKALHAADKEYLKMLVGEARTNTDLQAPFKAADGTRFMLRVDVHTGDLVVARAP